MHCKKCGGVLNLPSLSQFQLALFIETEMTGGSKVFAVHALVNVSILKYGHFVA